MMTILVVMGVGLLLIGIGYLVKFEKDGQRMIVKDENGGSR